jgi:hypothetical protein
MLVRDDLMRVGGCSRSVWASKSDTSLGMMFLELLSTCANWTRNSSTLTDAHALVKTGPSLMGLELKGEKRPESRQPTTSFLTGTMDCLQAARSVQCNYRVLTYG